MRAALLFLSCTTAAVMTPRAHAQERVVWEAPPECPGADVVHALVEELAGVPVQGAARATVSRDEAGLVAWIHGGDGSEPREIRAASCETLAAAVALVIATAMTDAATPAIELPEPVAAPTLEDVPDEPPPEDEVEAPEGESALRMIVSASTGAVLGIFGGAEALVGIAVGLRADGFELTAGWSRAFRIEEPDRDTTRATVRLGWVMGWEPFELSFRLLGEVYTSFRGLGNDRSGGLWGMVGAGTELRLWIEGIAAVTLAVDGTVPVAPTPIHLEGPRRLDDVSTLVGVVSGGVLFPLP